MHLYVVSRFYWGVLQRSHADAKKSKKSEYKYETDSDRVNAITDVVKEVSWDTERAEITWQMWCKSLRFNSFADIKLDDWTAHAISRCRQEMYESRVYSVAPLRLAILRICRMISTDNNLNAMWDRRREGLTPRGTFKKACSNMSGGPS